MSTKYPSDREESGWTIQDLKREINVLKEERRVLNSELMKTKTELGEAQDTLRRWRAELEIVASKTGHNVCHVWVVDLLKNTLGHNSNFPDPGKITPEQFAEGCAEYHRDLFGSCGIRLEVVKEHEVRSK